MNIELERMVQGFGIAINAGFGTNYSDKDLLLMAQTFFFVYLKDLPEHLRPQFLAGVEDASREIANNYNKIAKEQEEREKGKAR